MTTFNRLRSTRTAINRLRNIGPTSNAPVKFIVDTTPFDGLDDEQEPPKDHEWVITGRLLPSSDTYKNGAIKIQILIPSAFPFKPPIVRVTTPVFHPNIAKDGEVCIDALKQDGTWGPTTMLDAAIIEVTTVIDKPRIDHIQHTEAAHLYDNDRDGYFRKAAEVFNKNCAPRN